MMFSMEKCSGHSCTGTSEDSKLFTGGGEVMGKEGVPTDEVASAVAAVSDEIGDILKDELGDVDRAERMGAELADLSAELGILAGLADGETQLHFPALFEIAMHQTDSGSASGSGSSGSSSSWSYEQRWRSRRPARPPRAPRRPIAKGKELSRRKVGGAARGLRTRRPPSDASDVGADSDSDSHWTDINTGSSDSSSKEVSAAEADCNGFGDKPMVEGRVMGQLLLPLLCTEPTDHRELYIRHDHIVKSLISAEEVARAELRLEEVLASDNVSDNDADLESAPVTPEEEAALLQFVCGPDPTPPTQDMLQEYEACTWWCVCGGSACGCTVCAVLYRAAPPLLHALLRHLAADGKTYPAAVSLMRALGLQSGSTEKSLAKFNPDRFKKIHFCDEATAVIHVQLSRLAAHAGAHIYEICQCKPMTYVMDQAHAVEGLFNVLEGYKKIALNYSLQVLLRGREQKKMLSLAGGDANNTCKYTANDNAIALPGYKMKHRCDCQTTNAWCAQKWQQMISRSTVGISPMNNPGPENEKNSETPLETKRELQQGDGTGAKPPDSTEVNALVLKTEDTDISDTNVLDEISESESSYNSGSSSSGGGKQGVWRGVAHLMKCIASVERLMDRVLRHSARCPNSAKKRVDMGLTEVDRKLMAMYRRLPEVHRRQLQVYRKQKKLSTVCMQLVGGSAPPPPAPGPPPPAAAPQLCPAVALHYHLHHIKEVRRKVMHMRDQQLYYHRLRMWLEEQLKQVKDGTQHLAIEDAPRRKKSSSSQSSTEGNLIKSHKILQLLRQKAPIDFVEEYKNEGYRDTDEEVDPPEAFPLEKDNNISDSDTIVGEKETQEFCKEMKDCLVKFANFALDTADEDLLKEYEIQADDEEVKFPEAVSPPLQEMSPTAPESIPVYTPKPSQRLLTANKLLNLNSIEFKDDRVDFTLPPDLNVPLNARRTPVLVEETDVDKKNVEMFNEMKSLMPFNDIKDSDVQEILDKIDSDNPVDVQSALSMVAGMFETLASNPDLMNKVMRKAGEIQTPANETITENIKLSDDTIRTIKEMKLKSRTTVKVTKNTAKRKINRKFKNIDNDTDEVVEIDANSTENNSNIFVINNANNKDEDEERESAIKMFDDLVKNTLSLDEMKDMFKSTVRKDVTSKIPLALIDHEQEELFENIIIKDLAKNEADSVTDKILERIEEYRKKYDDDYESEEGCEASKESLKQATRMIIYSVDDTFDCLIMKVATMSQDNLYVLKSLKFKYIDILKRCVNSRELICWILHEPDVAANVIHELANLPPKNDNVPELNSTVLDRKKEYFIERLQLMHRVYMETLPKKSISGKDWLILLYKLEKIKDRFAEQFKKIRAKTTKPLNTTQTASEAEILAAKGLSKIIGKANARPKQTNVEPNKTEEATTKENDDRRIKTEAILAKGEAILKSRGDKSLMKSFYIIKSCINQGLPLPEVHKNHIISICSSYDAKLDEDIAEALKGCKTDAETPNHKDVKTKPTGENEEPESIPGHPEDCECKPCQQAAGYKLGVMRVLKRLEEEEKDKVKTQEKPCDPPAHQQHICKVGHTNNGSCVGDSSPDQPCTCCYCTVFGHAPPVTTPVPRNFNETRERLRSILNKKKQKSKSDEQDNQGSDTAPPINKPKPQLMPPALPKCLPPSLTPAQTQQKRQAIEKQQKMLADKMAALTVENKTEVDITPEPSQPPLKHKSPPLPTLMPEPLTAKPPPQQPQPKPPAQQKPQQKNPEPIYDIPIHNRPNVTQEQQTQTKPTLTPQQQQQIWQQQRGRQKERAVSVSSRDTSVFSTSSDSSASYYWRGNRAEDPRDLDALLQYIEGPQARHVDREKKRAKKQRQKYRKLESHLEGEVRRGAAELKEQQARIEKRRLELNFTKKRMADIIASKPKIKKGKKQKLTAAQVAKLDQFDEQIREVTLIINAAEQNLQENEQQISVITHNFNSCVTRLNEVRAHNNAILARQHQQQQQHKQQQQQQQQQLCEQQQKPQLQPVSDRKQLQMVQLDRQKPVGPLSTMTVRGGGIVRVRRCSGAPPELTLCPPHVVKVMPVSAPAPVQVQAPPAKPKAEKPQEQKKQTWEQALAHINQLAKSAKEKKKQKEKEQPPTVAAKTTKKLPQKQPEKEEPPLSKKQRKLLAKQQAEEEEKRKEKELEKLKKSNKKADKATAKADTKKAEKPPANEKKNKEQKKAEKKAENETKRAEKEKQKDSKQEKNAAIHQSKPAKNQPPVQQQPTKKEKKKQQQQQQNYQQQNHHQAPPSSNNTQQDTNNKSAWSGSSMCSMSSTSSSGCSIMQQLSSGVQVGDLKLPPGITLTRLQPAQHNNHTNNIQSGGAWKCSQLPTPPTAIAPPPTLIHAAPTPVHLPEQPIIVAEPPRANCPPSIPKSKKSKKKTKKQEEPAKQEPAKMVTLRNPMFHPNVPQVQVVASVPEEIRIPEPIPMPPGGCQATITPTSNGMYTIRNPLMSMMHQQSMLRSPYPHYNYQNQEPPPKRMDVNLASFTQNNMEGYTLFNSTQDTHNRTFLTQDNQNRTFLQENQSRSFLSPQFSDAKPNVSPSPIGTRPCQRECNDESLFANNVQRPEPIGTPLKQAQEEYTSFYTPFPQDSNVFRNALFNEPAPQSGPEDLVNGDLMPYFQRLRVGSKLNSEVTIHHVTESKFYKQEPTHTGWPVERPEPYNACPPVSCENQEQDPYSRYQYLFQRRN